MRNMFSNRRRRTQSGHMGAMEFALAGPVFLSLVLGVMTVSHASFVDTQLTYAARSAARWASVRSSTSGAAATSTSVETFARSQAIGITPTSGITVTTTWPAGNTVGNPVDVVVNYNFAPMLKGFLNDTMTLSAKASHTIVR